ncbi:hypothetical protein ACFL0D_06795 [Thermoproteota archaeon]
MKLGKSIISTLQMLCSVKKEMNIRKNLTLLGLLTVIGIVMGGIGLALAGDATSVDDLPCDDLGPKSLLHSMGFWSQLSDEQRDMLYEETQSMLEAGATHEEIHSMKAAMLESWGIDAPLWSGPHVGGQGSGYSKMARDGQGNGGRFGGRGNGGQGSGLKRQNNNGACTRTG